MAACSAKGWWTAVFTLGYGDPYPETGSASSCRNPLASAGAPGRKAKADRDELAVSLRRTEFRPKTQNAEQDHSRWSPRQNSDANRHAVGPAGRCEYPRSAAERR